MKTGLCHKLKLGRVLWIAVAVGAIGHGLAYFFVDIPVVNRVVRDAPLVKRIQYIGHVEDVISRERGYEALFSSEPLFLSTPWNVHYGLKKRNYCSEELALLRPYEGQIKLDSSGSDNAEIGGGVCFDCLSSGRFRGFGRTEQVVNVPECVSVSCEIQSLDGRGVIYQGELPFGGIFSRELLKPVQMWVHVADRSLVGQPQLNGSCGDADIDVALIEEVEAYFNSRGLGDGYYQIKVEL